MARELHGQLTMAYALALRLYLTTLRATPEFLRAADGCRRRHVSCRPIVGGLMIGDGRATVKLLSPPMPLAGRIRISPHSPAATTH